MGFSMILVFMKVVYMRAILPWCSQDLGEYRYIP